MYFVTFLKRFTYLYWCNIINYENRKQHIVSTFKDHIYNWISIASLLKFNNEEWDEIIKLYKNNFNYE